jgi:hypothetical protein
LADSFDLNLTYSSENRSGKRFAPLINDALDESGVNVEVPEIQFGPPLEMARTDAAAAQGMCLLRRWLVDSGAGVNSLRSMFHSG